MMESLSLDIDPDRDMFDEAVSDVFPHGYRLLERVASGLDKRYVLHLDLSCGVGGGGGGGGGGSVAAALSSHNVAVFDARTLSKKSAINQAHSKAITGLRFSPREDSLLYTSSLDGTAKLWDLREAGDKPVRTFEDATWKDSGGAAARGKPISALDVNSSDRFLCAGTEKVITDTFLLFFDVGEGSLLGGYWDCHGDDVTSVRFHAEDPNRVATGSTDGLVNVFDISQSSEEDALQHTLNTESSVQKVNWYEYKDKDSLCCLTHTEEVLLWAVDDVGPYKTFSRDDITIGLKRRTTQRVYVVDSHVRQQQLFVLAGSSDPAKPCLRLLSLGTKKPRLKPFADLSSPSVRTPLVRCSALDPKSGNLFTAGEDGVLCAWAPDANAADDDDDKRGAAAAANDGKINEKKRKHKVKPY